MATIFLPFCLPPCVRFRQPHSLSGESFAGRRSIASSTWDKKDGCFYIRFRYLGRGIRRSLRTETDARLRDLTGKPVDTLSPAKVREVAEQVAQETEARVDRMLRSLADGVARVPEGVDAIKFIISGCRQATPQTDAKVAPAIPQTPAAPRYTVGWLLDSVKIPPGVREANSEKTHDIHCQHLKRILGADTVLPITAARMQEYVDTRADERYRVVSVQN